MPKRLRSLSLRARLITLGGGAMLAVLVLAVVSTVLMSSFGTIVNDNATREDQAQTISHAYESWIDNDDQNNMYAAIIALRDPTKHQLAETTWAAGCRGLPGLRRKAQHEAPRRCFTIRRYWVSGRRSTRASRATTASACNCAQAALAGDARKAVYIATVGNLTPSNALPIEFAKASQRDRAQRNAEHGIGPLEREHRHGRRCSSLQLWRSRCCCCSSSRRSARS